MSVAFQPADGHLIGVIGLFVVVGWLIAYGLMQRSLGLPLIVGVVLRSAAILVHNFVTRLPDTSHDAQRFEREGWMIAQSLQKYGWKIYSQVENPFPEFIGTIYFVTGRSPIMVQTINMALSCVLMVYIYKLALHTWGKNAAIRSIWFVATYPTAILYSINILREIQVTLMLVLIVYHLVMFQDDRRFIRWLWIVLFAYIGTVFHVGMRYYCLLLPAVMVFSWVIGRLSKRPFLRYTVTIGLLALGFATLWVFLPNVYETLRFEELSIGQVNRAEGRSAYLTGMTVDTPFDLLLQFPLRLGYFLYSPFVWDVKNLLDIMGMVDGWVYLVLSMMYLQNRRRMDQNKGVRRIILTTGVFMAIFALPTSNSGTALRHRTKVLPLLIAALPARRRSSGNASYNASRNVSKNLRR